MPIVDHAMRLITCKLVYYGPGRSGKTTNLTYLHSALPNGRVGALTSLATRRDRTLFFDYLPVDLGTVGAYNVRFQLYTVPGQSYYRSIRQLVLHGADGVAFVADSQRHRWEDNIASMQDLHANLAEHGIDARTLPIVLQYNKQDLPPSLAAPVVELSSALNFRGVSEFGADASRGPGVFDTLRSLGMRVLRRLGADAADEEARTLDASVITGPETDSTTKPAMERDSAAEDVPESAVA